MPCVKLFVLCLNAIFSYMPLYTRTMYHVKFVNPTWHPNRKKIKIIVKRIHSRPMEVPSFSITHDEFHHRLINYARTIFLSTCEFRERRYVEWATHARTPHTFHWRAVRNSRSRGLFYAACVVSCIHMYNFLNGFFSSISRNFPHGNCAYQKIKRTLAADIQIRIKIIIIMNVSVSSRSMGLSGSGSVCMNRRVCAVFFFFVRIQLKWRDSGESCGVVYTSKGIYNFMYLANTRNVVNL